VSLGFVCQPAVAGGIVYLLADAGQGVTRFRRLTRRQAGGPSRHHLRATWADW
jgi:hypothetical protein